MVAFFPTGFIAKRALCLEDTLGEDARAPKDKEVVSGHAPISLVNMAPWSLTFHPHRAVDMSSYGHMIAEVVVVAWKKDTAMATKMQVEIATTGVKVRWRYLVMCIYSPPRQWSRFNAKWPAY